MLRGLDDSGQALNVPITVHSDISFHSWRFSVRSLTYAMPEIIRDLVSTSGTAVNGMREPRISRAN
jgi:hypothetical protein